MLLNNDTFFIENFHSLESLNELFLNALGEIIAKSIFEVNFKNFVRNFFKILS
jgi:hypothetical protein